MICRIKNSVNVKQGTDNNDTVVKSQIQLLDGARAGDVVNDKAVIYSSSGSVHAQSLHLKDIPGVGDGGLSNEIRIMTEHQSWNDIHFYIPDIKNYDGYGDRTRSEMMVTSVDQTIIGKMIFNDIEVANPANSNNAANKSYVVVELAKQRIAHGNIFVKTSGDTMTGALIVPNKNYPVQGNANELISYRNIRDIFLSRKESFPMDTSIDMNNNGIENLAEAKNSHEAIRKSQLDNALAIVNTDLGNKADKSCVDGEITKIPTIDSTQFIKKDGSVAMAADLDVGGNKITNVANPNPNA